MRKIHAIRHGLQALAQFERGIIADGFTAMRTRPRDAPGAFFPGFFRQLAWGLAEI
jgi:hypothetical protein